MQIYLTKRMECWIYMKLAVIIKTRGLNKIIAYKRLTPKASDDEYIHHIKAGTASLQYYPESDIWLRNSVWYDLIEYLNRI